MASPYAFNPTLMLVDPTPELASYLQRALVRDMARELLERNADPEAPESVAPALAEAGFSREAIDRLGDMAAVVAAARMDRDEAARRLIEAIPHPRRNLPRPGRRGPPARLRGATR